MECQRAGCTNTFEPAGTTPKKFCSAFCRKKNADQSKRPSASWLLDVLQKHGVSPDEIGKIDKVKVSEWETQRKGGGTEVLNSTSLVLSPKWESGPEWPVIQPAKPTVVRHSTKSPRRRGKWKRAAVLTDPQIGYRLLPDGELDPFHDEAAMAASLAVCGEVEPDLIINGGDLADFTAQSRWEQRPEWQATTQAGIDRSHRFLAEQRALAPNADIEVHEGNHDKRLSDFIMKNALAAFGLRRANAPQEWPVLTVPYLLRLEELGIKYVDGYPANESWINDRLKVQHAPARMTSVGSSAARTLEDERVSNIFGHTHRLELVHRTRPKRGGYTQILAAGAGCLCRIDGAVPGTNTAVDTHGRPVLTYKDNWQQGMVVVTYQEGDAPFNVELVPIIDGVAYFRGQTFAG